MGGLLRPAQNSVLFLLRRPSRPSHTGCRKRSPLLTPILSQALWDVSEYFFEDGVLANENVDEDVKKLCQSCLSKSTKKDN